VGSCHHCRSCPCRGSTCYDILSTRGHRSDGDSRNLKFVGRGLASLAKMEARERAQLAEAENTASLAFIHGEADKATRKVTQLEGELVDSHQSQEMAEVKLQGLSDVNHWWEDAER
jgi:hypothetical protein